MNDKQIRSSLRKDRVHLPPEGMKLLDDPKVYRRDIFSNWISARSSGEMNELVNLENMFLMLKGSVDSTMYKKWLLGKGEFTTNQLAQFKLMKDIAVELHKLKYGEKKVNMNVGVSYETIQEMMMQEELPKEPKNETMP